MRVFLAPAIEAVLAIYDLRLAFPLLDVESAIVILRRGPIEKAEFDYSNGKTLFETLPVQFLDEIAALPMSSKWRRILRRLALETNPIWAVRLPQGRENTLAAMDEDTIQCLRYAQLIDSPLDNEGVEWWDGLASEARRLQDRRRLEAGREGERLSLQHEIDRLKPYNLSDAVQWLALEDNSLGYDIVSREPTADAHHEIYIEVKACRYSPITFYLSRNEWETAFEKRHRYVIHVWLLSDKSLLLIDFAELQTHVPFDSVSGKGRWNKVKVSL